MSQGSGRQTPVSRRAVLQAAALSGGAALVAGAPLAPLAVPSTASAASPAQLRTLSLQYLHATDLSDAAQALQAYGWLHAISTLQGLANRTQPSVFIDFLAGDERGDLRIDNYWLNIAQNAGWGPAASTTSLADIPAAVAAFRTQLNGAVVWDPKVPATSNVASTVAGADGLIAVPYDTSAGSAYMTLVDPAGQDATRLPVACWLVNRDGSSVFTGSGTITGTQRKSSGSAKADAYWWALDNYLAAGKCDPTQLAYFLDAYWLTDTAPRGAWPHPLQNTLLSNHDYLVARRGFIFDLSPWSDEAPEDDPGQPVGADAAVLRAILRTAGKLAGGRLGAVRGFVPWAYKYSSPAGGKSWQLAGNAEWTVVSLLSSYGFYLDADAEGLDPLSNASLFQYFPVKSAYPAAPVPTAAQLSSRGFLNSDGTVAAKRYVMIYTGDFDSAAWAYHMIPRVWDDSARGDVTLNWAFDAHLAERMPLALAHVHDTASAADFFISGDSGDGYVSPGALTSPQAQRPGLLQRWTERNIAAYKQWGLAGTGFIIDGVAQAMTDAEMAASYGAFSPAGTVTSKSDPYGVIGSMPFVRMGRDLSGLSDLVGQFAAETYENPVTAAPLRPHFEAVRSILQTPSWHQALMAPFSPDAPVSPLSGPTTVSVTLGDPNTGDGLSQSDAPDGVTTVVTVDGVTGRQTAPGVGGNRYIYFTVDPSVINGSTCTAAITLTYLDAGTDTFNIQYDGTAPFEGAPSIQRAGTGQWKTATVTVSDAYFGKREQGQYDFRFEVPGGTADLTVSTVSVLLTPPPNYTKSAVEFLDAPTFFALLARHLTSQIVPECSAGILAPGSATSVVFRLHNFSGQPATAALALQGPAGTAVSGPRRVVVPPHGTSRVAYTVQTPAGTTGGTLALTVGGRSWSFAPAYQPNSYLDAPVVTATLGGTDQYAGIIRHELSFDGTTVSGTSLGRSWRASTERNNGFTREGYLYFAADKTFLADVNGGAVRLEVDYLDEPGNQFRVDYDAQDTERMLDGVLTPTPVWQTQGTGQWRTARFELPSVRFANRIPGSPDFRADGSCDFRIASPLPLKVAQLRLRLG